MHRSSSASHQKIPAKGSRLRGMGEKTGHQTLRIAKFPFSFPPSHGGHIVRNYPFRAVCVPTLCYVRTQQYFFESNLHLVGDKKGKSLL